MEQDALNKPSLASVSSSNDIDKEDKKKKRERRKEKKKDSSSREVSSEDSVIDGENKQSNNNEALTSPTPKPTINLPKLGEPLRVYIKRSGKRITGKVCIIYTGWKWEELLLKLGHKFDCIVTDVYLETPSGQFLQVEDVEEIKEGDTLIVSGISSTQQVTRKEEGQTNGHSNATDSNDLSSNLGQLTYQLGRLVSRLDSQREGVETIAQLIQKQSDTQQQQYARIMNALTSQHSSGHSGHHPHTEKSPNDSSKSALQFRAVKTFDDHKGPIWTLKVFSDLLFSGSSDKTIKVWDLTTLKLLNTLEGHTGIVHCLAISKGKTLISGSDDKSIRVWSLNEMKCINALYGHNNTVCEVCVTDKYLFSGSFNIINVWNVDTFQLMKTLAGHNHWVYSMCLYNTTMFTGSHNMIKVWDIDKLQCLKTIQTNGGKSIYSLCVAGPYLLSATFDNTIFVWNLKNFELLKTLTEHQACVLCLTVKDQWFFSGSYDTSVKVWNLQNLQIVDTLQHNSKVEAIVATDKYIISGSTDSTIKIWGWKKAIVEH